MSNIKSYRDLLIWQKSKELCILVYKNTDNFPKEEMFGLQSQMRRSAVSVPSNIAEGFSRYFTNDFPRYLRIALGSLYELQTQIEIAFELSFLTEEKSSILNMSCVEIEKMMNSLLNKIIQSKK